MSDPTEGTGTTLAPDAGGWPLLMTAAQVMATLVISRRTLYALVASGRLHPVRINVRLIRFHTPEVLEIAQAGYTPLRVPGLRGHDAATPAKTAEPA